MDYKEYRKKYLKQIKKINRVKRYKRASQTPVKENINKCPECHSNTRLDIDRGEIYCTDCGLIVKSSILYVGVHKINPPYGILL